jgi:hypothetical protein
MKTRTKPAVVSTFRDGPDDFDHLTITMRTLVDGSNPVRGFALAFRQTPDSGADAIDESDLLADIPVGRLNGITKAQFRQAINGINDYFRAKAGAV